MKNKFKKQYLIDILNPNKSFLYESSNIMHSHPENTLQVGETGSVILKANPSTGYMWHYKIEDDLSSDPFMGKLSGWYDMTLFLTASDLSSLKEIKDLRY